MVRKAMGLACVVAFGVFVLASALQVASAEDAGKTDAAKAPMVNVYKCDKTGKTWTQPASQKKACPFCGEAAPECGTLVKSEPGKTVYTCRMHKFVMEDKPGKCKICNLKLVETTVPLTALKKTRRGPNGEIIDVSKEPEACEHNEQ
jgi:hypothetical protein